jgi:hypothetical protein
VLHGAGFRRSWGFYIDRGRCSRAFNRNRSTSVARDGSKSSEPAEVAISRQDIDLGCLYMRPHQVPNDRCQSPATHFLSAIINRLKRVPLESTTQKMFPLRSTTQKMVPLRRTIQKLGFRQNEIWTKLHRCLPVEKVDLGRSVTGAHQVQVMGVHFW